MCVCVCVTERCSHGVLQRGLSVSWRQVESCEVSAFVVVVFDVEAGEFGELDTQRAAGVINILSI